MVLSNFILVDYSKRTGKGWVELIAIFFIFTSFGAVAKEIINSNDAVTSNKKIFSLF